MHKGQDKSSHACPSGGQRWLDGKPIKPLQLDNNATLADMVDDVFAGSGFNARRLADGAELFARMIDDGATIALTLAGAMTPIGMSGVLSALIERGFVDFIVSTGANLYHDLHLAYNLPMVQGNPNVDDDQLADEGVARIYDVFISDKETLQATDDVIVRAMGDFTPAEPISTARLHDAIGRWTASSAPKPERSFVVSATEHGVPIYTSSPGDSSIGMNLVTPRVFGRSIPLDPILDVLETTALVRDADSNGVVIVGGGSPKNFYLQTQPTLHQILQDSSKGGHDYVLQLTIDSPHWGGLSGATPSEARSWGKIKDATKNNVVVYSCASITLPIIAQYVLQRCKPRTPRRLFDRIGTAVDDLCDAAKNNPVLRQEYGPLIERWIAPK